VRTSAAMLSVLLFPVIVLALRTRAGDARRGLGRGHEMGSL